MIASFNILNGGAQRRCLSLYQSEEMKIGNFTTIIKFYVELEFILMWL